MVDVGTIFPGELGVEVVEEGGGGGHAAAEDGGGEFGGGPEGGGLEVVGFVGVAGAEGDDEAHDGCYAGAVKIFPLAINIHIWLGEVRTRDRRRRWPRRLSCALLQS